MRLCGWDSREARSPKMNQPRYGGVPTSNFFQNQHPPLPTTLYCGPWSHPFEVVFVVTEDETPTVSVVMAEPQASTLAKQTLLRLLALGEPISRQCQVDMLIVTRWRRGTRIFGASFYRCNYVPCQGCVGSRFRTYPGGLLRCRMRHLYWRVSLF